ncbi:hypothetical protein [Lentibacillus sp. Marseille-P4043]|nr:hypothetical protein [Lentibacillus sp. Marseille-P4043]
MGKVLKGFSKFIVANFAVILAILLLPVFLITDDVAIFDQVMDYLFNNKN